MKYVYGCCVVIGLLVLIGSAGASDCGTLEFGQAALRSIVGLLVFLGGLVGFKRIEKGER